jgi:hypothetical protein
VVSQVPMLVNIIFFEIDFGKHFKMLRLQLVYVTVEFTCMAQPGSV